MQELVKADEAFVAEGDLYEVAGVDGPIVTFNATVGIKVNGDTYFHNEIFPGHAMGEEGNYCVNSHREAQDFADRIISAGLKVNLKYWQKVDDAPRRCAYCGEIFCSAPCACHDLNS